jgi:two-component system chemotaxis response regulator CheY
MKVLLIDDSAIMRMMLKSLLKQVALEDVVEAGNGIEGLKTLESTPVDLIMLDLHMPEMDGPDFLRAVKKTQWSSIPVIVVSSDAESGQVKETIELGAKGYITKPFRIEGLREALADVAAVKG